MSMMKHALSKWAKNKLLSVQNRQFAKEVQLAKIMWPPGKCAIKITGIPTHGGEKETLPSMLSHGNVLWIEIFPPSIPSWREKILKSQIVESYKAHLASSYDDTNRRGFWGDESLLPSYCLKVMQGVHECSPCHHPHYAFWWCSPALEPSMILQLTYIYSPVSKPNQLSASFNWTLVIPLLWSVVGTVSGWADICFHLSRIK